MTNAIIFFTKAPVAGFCKTRLHEFLAPNYAANLQLFLIKKNLEILKNLQAKTFIFLDGKWEFEGFEVHAQNGENIGQKMSSAFDEIFKKGYKKVLLIGSDLADLKPEILNNAFEILDFKDVVFSSSSDGGYSLIGLKAPCSKVFELEKFSTENVLDDSLKTIKDKSVGFVDEILDIDTPKDIANFITNSKCEFLAMGEYNLNFKFKNKGKTEILRMKKGSQISVDEPSKYEFEALKFLEPLNITPKVFKLFNKSVFLPYGGFTMEFLEGRALDYKKDLLIAARILSKLHSFDTKNAPLMITKKPFLQMYEECLKFSKFYESSKFKSSKVLEMLEFFKEHLSENLDSEISTKSVINTELNSSNFIISKNSFIIDWEKPLIGDNEQDLAHFLVPTTTLFKSENTLTKAQIYEFLNEYSKLKSFDEKLLKRYLKATCFRGFSWCAFAYYQSKISGIKSPAYKKIKEYLSDEFIEKLKRYFLEL
ncbi:TIGR04282 family arsenosugar biosynthesis glycosyltransferase [Campylobacter corcagiensis]|uniref:TIGR04282 family arsenosugar biosynthesis glycosyltransferase n=1 Tax=Campylobacter corcagiensis TaxID=1448857 RepID=A0A7M1LGW2_9BACT|nr:TIGR04282 family arsenosugar biosynthesis glycosyltransferase [Campylobacter corcagiensis]QKF64750.1 transferase 1, rSAM/selenodomain-associated [Campylobacter corcagiensis]QOQ87086.1 TIGR04282 family arsenosugar biosynthesis glycosyltransferase [Campylobacter corcagiensis]